MRNGINMPIYTFKNLKTGDIFDKELKISERELFLQENKDLKQLLIQAPRIVDPVRIGVKKHPDSFKDLMKTIRNKSGGDKTKIKI